MDIIHVRSDLACIVGLLPRERIEPQRLHVDLRLELDLTAVGDSGRIEDGVDYAAIDARIRFLAVEGRFRLLESLALVILEAVLRAPVERASLTITKPDVLRAAIPGITMARDRAWARARPPRWELPEITVERRSMRAGEPVSGRAAWSLTKDTPIAPSGTVEEADELIVLSDIHRV